MADPRMDIPLETQRITSPETRTLHQAAMIDPKQQPTPVTPVPGYRVLSKQELVTIQFNKELEEIVLQHLDNLKGFAGIDQRWLQLGRTHLEQAFMAINRAIAQPQRIELGPSTLQIMMPAEVPA